MLASGEAPIDVYLVGFGDENHADTFAAAKRAVLSKLVPLAM